MSSQSLIPAAAVNEKKFSEAECAALIFQGENGSYVAHDAEKNSHGWSLLMQREFKKQCRLAGPMVVVNLLQYSLQLISVMFVGQLGVLSLASASISTSFAGVSGFSLLTGMGSALETLCGQAYGAHEFWLLGIYLQRALLCLNLVSLPVALIWINMGKVLLFFGQEADIAIEAGQYASWLLPALFAFACLQPLVKFLQAQSLVFPLVLSAALASCMHLIMCWLLVYKLNMGIQGAALALGMSYWLNVAILIGYVRLSSVCKATWTGFSWKAFRDLRAFLTLAIPSTVMYCLEYWSFHIVILISGLLPHPQLHMSALSICLNTITIVYMIPCGLGAAASTRVSNELGAKDLRAIRAVVYVAMFLALTDATLTAGILMAIRNIWGWAFNNEVEVVQYVATIMPLVAATSFFDAVQGVLQGVIRGSGRQSLGAFVNLGAFYIVGVPTGVILGIVYKLNGKGLWIGVLSGVSIEMVCFVFITLSTNWTQQIIPLAQRATDRVVSPSSKLVPLLQ
ncbi:hypothetical protein O6H91_08G003900 [Diphasiastrum complanatum]|uniref:Uncharacterized protein n=2 Tax=Diphasiastrum complanatum TaxID=34168 RepID=A0ACC2CUG6_DIPCM|nr:hypothetical protein O6H91_08G003900 [Diphasiastrum complanatum]KAJ7545617.1 hypothetical protein O6H91_08G003900 [Diphasiastrum complanatum]